ncbi:hypothetical protein [Acinetobacter sp. CWB-B33]|uniref:hypothetical protein n=1 Tax=Acinetobacter sp. CWB-B33 TaxID=2815724 RepID=UPI0031FE5731
MLIKKIQERTGQPVQAPMLTQVFSGFNNLKQNHAEAESPENHLAHSRQARAAFEGCKKKQQSRHKKIKMTARIFSGELP